MSGKKQLINVNYIRDRIEDAGLEDEEVIQNWALAAIAGQDAELLDDLEETLQLFAGQRMITGTPFKVPHPKHLAKLATSERSIAIGHLLETGQVFSVPMDRLCMHAFTLGTTGAGKTNLTTSVGLQAMQTVPTMWVDFHKNSFRHLIHIHPSLLVFNPQEGFAFNPSQPPKGVKVRDWIEIVVTVFCKTNKLLDGSEALFRKALYELFEERGIFSGRDDYPTFIDVLYKIKSYKFSGWNSRRRGYQESIINRLESYQHACPEMYGYSKGFPIDELFRHSMVLETAGIGEKHATFLVSILLFGLFYYRQARNERGNVLRNEIIIDEAKTFFPPGFNDSLGFLPLDYILAQSREAGIGLWIAEQTADLNPSVHTQSRMKICFRLSFGKHIKLMQQAMGLNDEQTEYILRLGVGQAIVRIPEIPYPFLIQVPKLPLE